MQAKTAALSKSRCQDARAGVGYLLLPSMTTASFPKLSGHTKPFAVLGHPIGHTLSPAMHNPALQALGMDAIYCAYDVRPDELMNVLRGMSKMGFVGSNLTIPHKEIAFRGVDHLGPSAELLGAVNTVVFRNDGTLEGHNTDGYGIVKAVEESFDLSPRDKDVLVLGCGGAGRAVALVMAQEGARHIRLANRRSERMDVLASDLRKRFPDVKVSRCSSWPPSPEETEAAELILQSTSVGMDVDDAPVLRREHFHTGQALMDLVYVFRETGIMQEAVRAGARAANGLGMLLHQGVRSLEIWTGREAPTSIMREALDRHVYGGASK